MKRLKDAFRDFFLKLFERYTKQFLTVHVRPIDTRGYGLHSDTVHTPTSLAIVMQGPLCLEDDFTLETVRTYKKNFVGATIIVSTWEGEHAQTLDLIRNEGVEVIVQATPTNPGISHINFQIKSTLAGVQRAKELGIDHVMKTRTDLRMYAPNISEFLQSMTTTFPLLYDGGQKERIFVTSLITFKYRMYGVTDITMYGHIDDMLLYWGAPFDTRTKGVEDKTMGGWAKSRICEVYLATNFLEAVGRKLLWTLEDSWLAYAEHFCIIDEESLDMYWHKYDRFNQYRFSVYDAVRTDQELSFREWLILYARGSNKSQIPEYASELRRSQPLKKVERIAL